MRRSIHLFLITASSGFLGGCGGGGGASNQPSYADLVVTLNAEQDALDRL